MWVGLTATSVITVRSGPAASLFLLERPFAPWYLVTLRLSACPSPETQMLFPCTQLQTAASCLESKVEKQLSTIDNLPDIVTPANIKVLRCPKARAEDFDKQEWFHEVLCPASHQPCGIRGETQER